MNRKYYYSNGGDRVGPVTLEELESLPELRPDTLLWYHGLSEWVRADGLPELSGIFGEVSPPVSFASSSFPPQVPCLDGSKFEKLLQLFSIRGRLRRRDYLIGYMMVLLAYFVGGMALLLEYVGFGMITILLCFCLSLVLGAKRCRDFGISGCCRLLSIILTLVIALFITPAESGSYEYGHQFGRACMGVEFLVGFILLFIEGNRGSNRYGLDPRELK
jgi:uncharacterized membrane protein YhaH (DUF805 family)